MNWMRIGGTAAVAAALAIGFALSLGLWGSWTASAQDTFIVNQDTGAGDPAPCDDPDFPSVSDIETVIDDASVQNGDTLVLCPGTYTAGAAAGAINVDKRLTIEGLSTADREDVVIQGAAGSHGLLISADKVTIRHLKLVGAGPADYGIIIEADANNNTIQDMEITAWNTGVLIQAANGNIVETSTIHTNGDGVYLDSGARNVVRNNDIEDNSGYGIELVGEDELLIEDNKLSGNPDNQIEVVGKSQVRIHRNQIDTTGSTSHGISIWIVPAETFIQIGGSAENANTFTGPFGDPDFYVNLHCSAQNTVDATYNWWGSTNRIDIANRIFNDEDDDGTECSAPDDVNGAVVFHPWATGPAPTPTPSPTPTATVTPTATATGTPTPTATPGATRTVDLSPPGWHSLVWSGADATDPATALACIAGKYSIAYAWEGPTVGFKRYVDGCAMIGLCNMSPLDKYSAILVNISADGATCVMPVAP